MKNKFLSFLTFACIMIFALGGKIVFAVPLNGGPIGNPSEAPLITEEVTEINTTVEGTLFKFIPSVPGEYTIKTTGAVDTLGTLYENLSLSILAERDDDEGANFVIKYNLIAGNTYYVGISNFVGDNLICNLSVTGGGLWAPSTAPTVQSVSVPSNGTYIGGQNLDFTVNFNENVTVTGTPGLSLTIGSTTRVASYVSGSGTSAVFRYTVQAEDNDNDGIAIGSLVLNGGTIRDSEGYDADLALNGVGTTTGVKVDALEPTINSSSLAESNEYIDITFSEGIYGANDGTSALTADKLALTFSQNGGTATNVTISLVKKNDSAVESWASALTGGETTVRVFLSVAGTPSGLEAIEIKPANALSIYDKAGNALSIAQTTGVKTLYANTNPTISAISNQSINENEDTGNIAFTIGDAETPASTLLVSATSDNEALIPNTGINLGGSGANRTIKLTPALNQHGTANVTITVTDSNGGTAQRIFTVTVNSINDAPVLSPAAPTLTTINASDTNNAGQTVASFIGTSISDVDSGALEGIAITAAANGNGTWEYSIDNGSTWTAIGAVAGNSALLLRDTDKVRFVPNGQDSTTASITYRAWDRTSGTQGSKVDASTNGGTSAFSTSTDTASILVTESIKPTLVSAVRTDNTHIIVQLSENCTDIAKANDGGFTVSETGTPEITYTVTAISQGSDASHVVLTVSDMAVSAKEGVTVKYTVGGNGTIQDSIGNSMATDGIGVTVAGWDTTAPTINSSSLAESNEYIDITFSEGIYGANDGTSALTADKLALTFTQNGGTATNITISSIKKNDSEVEDLASALTGGETTVRIFLNITGTPNGAETIEVRPSNASSIYDKAGNALSIAQTTGVKTLNDKVAPTFEPATGTSIDGTFKTVALTFSENILNALGDINSLKNAVTFAADGINFNALGINDTVTIESGKLIVTFESSLTGNTNKIKIAGNSLKDEGGNLLADLITTNSIVAPKADGPVVTGVSINDAENTISGLTSAMEFSTDGTTWTAYNEETPNLPDLTGNVELRVRVAATATHTAGAVTSFNFTIPTLSSIAITSPATKLSYKVGEALDITGLVVTGSYSDGTTKVETVAVGDITGFNSTAVAASQSLTINVGGKTTTYTIAVANADQGAPTETLVAVVPTLYGLSDGKITGTTSAMEYKLSTSTIWTPVTGTEITGLAAGTYNVRYAAKTGFNAGTSVDVVVGNGPSPEPYIPPTPTPTPKPEQITVDVTDGTTDNVLSETTIQRTTEADGTKKDEVKYTADEAEKIVEKLKEAGKDTARLVIPDEKDEVAEAEIKIPNTTLSVIAQGNINLQIDTENARINIPKDSIKNLDKDLKQDLFFRVVPIKEEQQRKKVIERAKQEEIVKQAAKGSDISVVGRPMTIETNMSQRAVDIVLPLKDVAIPSDPKEREKFFNKIGIFIEHSDGEKVLTKGEVVEYKNGVLGIKFTIKKFSTFTIIKLNEGEFDENGNISSNGGYGGPKTFMPDKDITITFNKDLNEGTLTKDSIYVENSKGNKVEAVLKYNSTRKTVTVTPSKYYNTGETYYLCVTDKLLSTTGKTITNKIRYSFNIGNVKLDKTKKYGEYKDVSQNKVWTVKLNEAIDLSKLNSANIKVYDENCNEVEVVIDNLTDNKTIRITPKNAFQKGKSYYLFLNDIISEKGIKLKEAQWIKYTIIKD